MMSRSAEASGSTDPIVRSALERLSTLQQELTLVDSVMGAYAARVTSKVPGPASIAVALLDHSTMLDSQHCSCVVCADWTQRREELVDANALVPIGHKWSTCSCSKCRFVKLAYVNYTAASTKRDVLIETAYHAQHHSKHGNAVMAWMEKAIRDERLSMHWWAREGARQPLRTWLLKCEAAVGPQVSGVVFRMD